MSFVEFMWNIKQACLGEDRGVLCTDEAFVSQGADVLAHCVDAHLSSPPWCIDRRKFPIFKEFYWKFIKNVVRYKATAGGVVSEGKIPDWKLSPKEGAWH